MHTLRLLPRMLTVGFALALASQASAAVLADYTFAGSTFSGNPSRSTDPVLTSFDSDPHSVASSIFMPDYNKIGDNLVLRGLSNSAPTNNSGSTAAAPIMFFRSSETDAAYSSGNNDYLEFKLTINAGFAADLTKISYDIAANNASGVNPYIATWEVRSSLDGFATALGTSSTSAGNYTHFDISLASLSALQSVGGTAAEITFRLYSFDNGTGTTSSGSGVNRIDNIRLEGAISAIPEPSSVSMLLGLSVLGWVVARRRALLG